MAYLGERRALPVPDRDDERIAYEEHQLVGGDRVALRLVHHRLDDHEEGVVVHLQLGPLVRAQRVLHGQRVQPELAADEVELLLRGLVQSDPEKSVPGGPCLVEGIGEVGGSVGTTPVPVDGTVHNHGAHSSLLRAPAHLSGYVGLRWPVCRP